MPTVKVNELTLTHKGSGGFTVATIPDVCLTPAPPGPPVPIPYPNFALSSDLVSGTTTVTADGGNMIAIQGSQFMKSTGDEPGVAGGVASGVNMKETNWMTYSMDVFFDGKNACRLTDKQFHNHYNTVNMGGQGEVPLPADPALQAKIDWLCNIICYCAKHPNVGSSGRLGRQDCVDAFLKATEIDPKVSKPKPPEILPSTPFVRPDHPPQVWTPKAPGSPRLPPGSTRTPDVPIVKDPSKPPTADNIDRIVEIKFDYGKKGHDRYTCEDQKDDADIAGGKDKVLVLTPAKCGCEDAEDFDPYDQDCEEDQVTEEQYEASAAANLIVLAIVAYFAIYSVWGLAGAAPAVAPGVPAPGPPVPGPPVPGPPVPGPPVPGPPVPGPPVPVPPTPVPPTPVPPGGPLGPPQLPPGGGGPPGPFLPPGGGGGPFAPPPGM